MKILLGTVGIGTESDVATVRQIQGRKLGEVKMWDTKEGLCVDRFGFGKQRKRKIPNNILRGLNTFQLRVAISVEMCDRDQLYFSLMFCKVQAKFGMVH